MVEEAQDFGHFAVRFIPDRKLGVRAQLTGDFWRASETSIAKAVVRADSDEAMIENGSPMYLVPEHVVRVWVR